MYQRHHTRHRASFGLMTGTQRGPLALKLNSYWEQLGNQQHRLQHHGSCKFAMSRHCFPGGARVIAQFRNA